MTTRSWTDALPPDACAEAVQWARGYPTAQATWEACERGDWMGWLLHHRGRAAEIASAERAYNQMFVSVRRAYAEAAQRACDEAARRAYAEAARRASYNAALASARRAYAKAVAPATRAYAEAIRAAVPEFPEVRGRDCRTPPDPSARHDENPVELRAESPDVP